MKEPKLRTPLALALGVCQKDMRPGFILINKPINVSSFDCVYKIKKLFRKETIGHSGTLDKEASGLMIICIGRTATKLINNFLNLDKQYIVKAKLGELTTTLDYSGEIIKTEDVTVTESQLLEAISSLGESYEQVPPIYSALKHKGQPLYKLAREKMPELEKIAKTKTRTVKLYSLKLISFDSPYFIFHAHVSKGTYVRSLANDIAKQIETYATTYEIIRTHIGKFELKDAINLEDITQKIIESNLIGIEKMGRD